MLANARRSQSQAVTGTHLGLTEPEARRMGLAVRTGSGLVARSARGWIHGPGHDGFFKLVEDRDRGVLVGASSVGPRGGEVLSMLALACRRRCRWPACAE